MARGEGQRLGAAGLATALLCNGLGRYDQALAAVGGNSPPSGNWPPEAWPPGSWTSARVSPPAADRENSRAAGDGFARYWLHNGLLGLAGEKMSRSLGNSVLVSDVLTWVRAPELYEVATIRSRVT